jgi:2-polyprenyl-3-methyl-5-hydroxy-6-metoxy-1,4-benzoquinol methylase
MAAIEANWDERTPIHAASRFYDVDARDPDSWFAGFEWADLGDLAGRQVLHLQCHLGTETAAFARRGVAGVVGLDLSPTAVAEAGRIATAAGLTIEYVQANMVAGTDGFWRLPDDAPRIPLVYALVVAKPG